MPLSKSEFREILSTESHMLLRGTK